MITPLIIKHCIMKNVNADMHNSKSNKVLIFDTSIASENLGDKIINDAVTYHLFKMLPNYHFLNTATHESIGKQTYRLNQISEYSFVAGTNLLSSNMDSYNQWKINLVDSIFLKNIILIGVGWWQYQKDPNIYTQILYNKIFHKKILHSVRDEYTLRKLRSAGFSNVINTGCPTMWQLTPDFCEKIPEDKADSVVLTLTDYNQDPESDNKIINLLRSNYEQVFYWPQGTGDLNYFQTLNSEGINILPSSLDAYNNLLRSSESIDYVGTRLHAGIRSLQLKRRSIILAVDNRAAEKKKDTNLPVTERTNFSEINRLINSSWKTEIHINETAITTWKGQFSS